MPATKAWEEIAWTAGHVPVVGGITGATFGLAAPMEGELLGSSLLGAAYAGAALSAVGKFVGQSYGLGTGRRRRFDWGTVDNAGRLGLILGPAGELIGPAAGRAFNFVVRVARSAVNDLAESLSRTAHRSVSRRGFAYTPLWSSGGGKALGDWHVEPHSGMPTPRPSGVQSHHDVHSVWMTANFPRYNPNDAPTILMRNVPGHNSTRSVFNRIHVEIAARQGVSPRNIDWTRVSPGTAWRLAEEQFDAAMVPPEVRAEYFRQFNDYLERIRRAHAHAK